MDTGMPLPEVAVPVEAVAAAGAAAARPPRHAAVAAGAAAGAAAGGAAAARPPRHAAVAAGGAAAARPPRHAAVARGVVAWARAVGGTGGARRVAWAVALFVMGCAAAALALFAMTLPAADSQLQGDELACKRTPADVLALRTASQILLLLASAQVIAAALAVLVPAPLVAGFAYIVGWYTAFPATDVLWMLVACHDETFHDDIHSGYHFVRFLLFLMLAVGTLVSLC